MIARHFGLGLALLLLPALAGITSAAAQNKQDKPDKSVTTRSTGTGALPAPVGHRQPTASDVAKTRNDGIDPDEAKRELEIDKKLQICRGC